MEDKNKENKQANDQVGSASYDEKDVTLAMDQRRSYLKKKATSDNRAIQEYWAAARAKVFKEKGEQYRLAEEKARQEAEVIAKAKTEQDQLAKESQQQPSKSGKDSRTVLGAGSKEISEIYSSGILNKGEEITDCLSTTYCGKEQEFYYGKKQSKEYPYPLGGFLVFTNKRFIFLKRPVGFSAKGFNVVLHSSWRNLVSVSKSATLNVSIQMENGIHTHIFTCKKVEDVVQKVIERKNKYVEETKIEAKTVIIEEANKDKAMEILQKRLARGEITLDEFHKLVTRT